MKVLMVIDSLVRGGRERRLIELLKRLATRKDVEPHLCLLSDDIHYPEIHDLDVPLYTIIRYPKKDPRVFYKLYKLCKKIQPDVLHSWGSMPSIYSFPTTKLLGIPLLNAFIADAPKDLTISHQDYLRGKITFPFSDIIVGNSEAGLRAYDAPENKTVCVYNGFDPDRIANLPEDKADIRVQYQVPDLPIVGMVGGFFERKDYFTYINSAIRLLKSGKRAIFFAVGDGPLLEQCKCMVPKEWSEYFRFTGMVKAVEELISIFDVGVLATNSAMHGEGISNSILEYMWLGIPVIATEGGGTDEIVEHDINGYKVAFADDKDMANSINKLLVNAELRKRLGSNGRAIVQKKFSLDKMEAAYLEIYTSLIKPNPSNQKVVC